MLKTDTTPTTPTTTVTTRTVEMIISENLEKIRNLWNEAAAVKSPGSIMRGGYVSVPAAKVAVDREVLPHLRNAERMIRVCRENTLPAAAPRAPRPMGRHGLPLGTPGSGLGGKGKTARERAKKLGKKAA